MENNYYPRTYPGFQYFPPPSAWIDPNSVSSDDNKIPTWVIVGVVIVVVMLCSFLFYYIRRREKKILKIVALVDALAAKPAPPTTPKKDTAPPSKPAPPPAPKPPPPPPMGIPIGYPGDCPECGHRGGQYSFKYTCPQCKWKIDQNVGH